LEELAARLGSDTAFFVRNQTQMARGRGELLEPFDLPLSGLWLMIVKPPVHVSTAEAYRGVTPRVPERRLAQRLGGDPRGWRETVRNDFERSLFEARPVLAAVKKSLYDAGAVYASLSGSGAALYGLFGERPTWRGEGNFVYLEKIP
jgi:4-diphosphocytidyl-2-C-methyl-D-erythritol kinase